MLRLFEAPHYFRRAGKGRFRKAPAEILQQALAAIEKKKQVAGADRGLGRRAGRRQLPGADPRAAVQDPVQARQERARIQGRGRGLARHPHRAAGPAAAGRRHRLALPVPLEALPVRKLPQGHRLSRRCRRRRSGTSCRWPQVRAFSIDDSSTTEIDDALSVQGLGTGTVTVGIHIAAPGLALQPASADRPGGAPAPVHGLHAGLQDHHAARRRGAGLHPAGRAATAPPCRCTPTFDEATLALKDTRTRLERVPIVANLRHDQLDARDHRGMAAQTRRTAPARCPTPVAALREPLSFLFRLASHLKSLREVVRGKPENFNRPDYNFRLIGNDGAEPDGDEQVQITVRRRGAPLDLIVSEAMILANSTWGNWLGELGVPAIYRSQASLAPGVKVRMGTKAAAARRHRRQELRLEHLAAAPLHRPGEPVADHRRRAPRPHGGTGGAVQAQGRRAVLRHLRLRRRVRRLQRPPGRHGTLLDAAATCSSRASPNWWAPSSRKAWCAPTTCRWCCRCWAAPSCRAARGCA